MLTNMFKPQFSISPAMTRALMQIEAARQAVSDAPIRVEILHHLRETARLHSAHYSTQIEGNRLTLPEVAAAQRGEKLPGRERDEIEVRNHFRAFAYMEKISEAAAPLQEAEIQTLHGLVLFGKQRASAYRDVQNVIRESGSGRIVYLPPEAPDVPVLMRELVEWVNAELLSGELPVPIIAGLAHYQFATIHPYLDGNGRTARLLTTLILRRAGYGLKGIYSLDEQYAKDLAAYYSALTIGHHNYYEGRAEADLTGFVGYFLVGMAAAFQAIKLAATRDSAALPDESDYLRDLDPRQRNLIPLFRKQGSATAIEMASTLKLSPRTVVALCRQWIASGFLEYADPSRKARAYRLRARKNPPA